MTFGSLFSGVGGIDLGLERAGMVCRWQVEIDPFCCKVLEKHWPGVKRYGDITQLDGRELEHVDLLAGGFPCQDLSQAGKRAGIEGTRSGLWFEFARLIGKLRPRWVLIENVPGLLVPGAMPRVVGELDRLGYVGIWLCLRASDFGASHLRKRVFLVALSQSGRRGILRQPSECNGFADGRGEVLADAASERHNGSGNTGTGWRTESANGNKRLAHTFSAGLEIRGVAREQDETAFTESEPVRLPRFAPGPSDPRWSAILRARPDLAPALANPIGSRYEKRHPRRSDNGPDGSEGQIRESAGTGIDGNAGNGAAPSQSQICRMADGLSAEIHRALENRTKRLSRLGNSVVPQVAEYIGRKILEAAQ